MTRYILCGLLRLTALAVAATASAAVTPGAAPVSAATFPSRQARRGDT